MKIRFMRTDNDIFGEDEIIHPIIQISRNNDVYISILTELLFKFNTYTEKICFNVEKTLKLFQYRVEEDDIEEYAKFSKLVYNFYYTVVDDDFGREIEKNNVDFYNQNKLRFADKRLHLYRGRLFEVLISSLVEPRFVNEYFETGCKIFIYNSHVFVRYGEGMASHKETFDIAGWIENSEYGEFYECKINPERFTEANYRLLEELEKRLLECSISNCIIAFVSADSTNKILQIKRDIEEKNKNISSEFRIIGRDSISEIPRYEIPEIA